MRQFLPMILLRKEVARMPKNKKYKKLKKKYKILKGQYDEVSCVLDSTLDDNRHMAVEMEYRGDFIVWKSLEDEYKHFKGNAFRDPNDKLPFPRYIL